MFAVIAGLALAGKDIIALLDATRNSSGQGPAVSPERQPQGFFAAPSDLTAWTAAVRSCAIPGDRVHEFVRSFPGSPAQQIAAIYDWTATHWTYKPDTGTDFLASAETIAATGFTADCKAVAIWLAAVSAELGIRSRVVVTRGRAGKPGHLHTEIAIAGPNEDPTEVLDVMKATWAQRGRPVFANQPLPIEVTGDGYTFLILDGGVPPSRPQLLGDLEAVISTADTKPNQSDPTWKKR
jgi:hypothetical protein